MPVPPPYKDSWEMSQQTTDYFNNKYKNNPLRNIEHTNRQGPLLDTRNFRPYFDNNGEPMDPWWTPGNEYYWGYTYPGTEDIYLANLDEAGYQVPVPTSFSMGTSRAEKLHPRTVRAREKKQLEEEIEEALNKQEFKDQQSQRIARVGTHETIHNIFNKETGAYPNAIAEILRGTSHLGIPGDMTKYLENPWYSPNFEQDELLTQALTELINPAVAPANATFSPDWSPIMSDFDYSHWNMDKPGGPMTKKGLDNFLFERIQPFYEQILSDADKGYVQDSIWVTPSYLKE